MRVLRLTLINLLMLLGLAVSPALAHISGYTDTSIQITAAGVRLIYTAPRDNLLEIGGAPTAAGDRAGTAASGPIGPPEQYLRAVRDGWSISSGGERCLITQAQSRALDSVASYQYQFTYACPGGLDDLRIQYTLLFERWPEHENYARVFLAEQRQRLRFTAEKPTLDVPVAMLLARFGQPLAAGFFDSDPHRAFTLTADSEGAGQTAKLPKVVAAVPSLGTLDFSQIDPGFVRLGVGHIFGGVDHLLFVVGLVMLTRTWRRLLLLVTAFTLAHSVTMALSTMGWIELSPAVAEPLIALTIVYIGVENLWALRRGAATETSASPRLDRAAIGRTALVFAFGLIHGVGFSYALRQMGLREDLLGSLLYFNAGVELGQLAIIALAWPLVRWLRRATWSGRVSAGVSTAVALAGVAMMAGRL